MAEKHNGDQPHIGSLKP